MFPGAGTTINIITIIAGASLGVLVGNKMSTRTRTLLTDVLGLVTLLGAASALIPLWSTRYVSAMPQGWTLLVVLGSLLIAGLAAKAVLIASIVALSSFTVLLVLRLAAGDRPPCACLSFRSTKPIGWSNIVRNFLMLALLVAALIR